MFSFVVCVVLATFATSFGEEYYPTPEYVYQPYQEAYAPEYHNYEPKDYHFEYSVSDPHTGDHKSQWEIKEKGVVRGMYSLLEPDGTTRVVEYIADHDGFRATVKKLGAPILPHHGEQVIVSLPEAFNNGYHGAYSGEQQNYGIEAYTPPIEEIGHPEHIVEYAAPVPLEHHQHHHHEEVESPPVVEYTAPVDLGHHHDTTVEFHGYTGNPDDDSSYTNYEHKGPATSYQNVGHGSYVAQPEIAPVAYNLPYQLQKPYAYSGSGATSYSNFYY